jgi:hypothetical protein
MAIMIAVILTSWELCLLMPIYLHGKFQHAYCNVAPNPSGWSNSYGGMWIQIPPPTAAEQLRQMARLKLTVTKPDEPRNARPFTSDARRNMDCLYA